LGTDVLTHDNSAPIQTLGDELEGSLQKGRTRLKGNVVIIQGDAEMKSDEAEIFSLPNSTTPQRAVAKGNVRLLKRPNPKVPEIRGTADEIEYFVMGRRVILKGKPKIWRADELIQGEVIELSLDTGDVKIRSARSILDPKNAPKK
jgi:lipopolysaccharide transport protein LptA